jgi:mannose-6-phosphate isomerase-like protein (cupin superfamily)
VSEADDQLREMAAHRGLKLAKSRRRKPGGDYGLYGLKDAGGAPVFGFGEDGFTASAEDIEAYLRDSVRATWGESAEREPDRSKAKPAPKPTPKPAPPPKPRFKVAVANLLTGLPAAKRGEVFTELLARPGVRIERIVSRGQATPKAEPMVQDTDEWVLLLEGAAGIRIEDSDVVSLSPGDHLFIARGQKHWVAWTAKDRPSVWLAIHFD